jgi:sirohydrochlorin cobaltochelatase
MSRRGVILLAHGARDPRWSEPFESLASRYAALVPDVPLALAFLEFMAPDLPEAADRLVARGCDELVVVPAFLGVGGHVRSDVPKLVEAIGREHPGVRVTMSVALGEVASVQDAMAHAVAAAARA